MLECNKKKSRVNRAKLAVNLIFSVNQVFDAKTKVQFNQNECPFKIESWQMRS